MLILKPQDILILLKVIALAAYNRKCSPTVLASELWISRSEVNEAFSRTASARLFDIKKRQVRVAGLEELLVHGLKYFFPAVRGGISRGIPTSYAAAPLKYQFDVGDNPPIWEHPAGTVRGYKIDPLYKTAVKAALADSQLYELLALIDAIRDGEVRERGVAIEELKQRLANYLNNIRSEH